MTLDLTALEAARDAATPGEWLVVAQTIYALDEVGDVNRFSAGMHSGYKYHGRTIKERTEEGELSANAALIVLVINSLSALIAAARERDELREWVIAFGGPWAVQYGQNNGWPEGHMHPDHYDILENCGARMTDFVRHAALAKGNAS